MHFVIAISVILVSLKGVLIYIQGEKSDDLFDVGNLWVLGPGVVFVFAAIKTFRTQKVFSPVQLAIFGWCVVLFFHGIYNLGVYGPTLALLSLLPWGVWIPVGLWGSIERKHRPDFVLALTIFLVALAFALSVLFEYFTGNILLRLSNQVAGQDFFRYSGLSGSPVSTGLTLTCGLFACGWILTSAGSILLRCAAFLVACLIVLSSLLCLGRLALVLGVIGLLVQARVLFKQAFVLGIIGLISAVIGAAVVGQFLSANRSFEYLLQAFNFQEGGNVERLRVYQLQLSYLADSPFQMLAGSGAGSTGMIALKLFGDEETTESSIIRLVREFGILGSASFLVVCIVVVRSFLIGLRRERQKRSAVVFLTLFVIVLIQATFAEALDGWVNSFFLWASVSVAAYLERDREEWLQESDDIYSLENESQSGEVSPLAPPL